MRDYPIGTFLFWNINAEVFNEYIFNKFINEYVEQKDCLQRGEKAIALHSEYSAVLDGQQRITSIFLGVKGVYKEHIKGMRWDSPNSFKSKYLCINVFHLPSDEDDIYQFCFKASEEIGVIVENEQAEKKLGIKVSDAFVENFDVHSYIEELEERLSDYTSPLNQRKEARQILQTLNNVLLEKPNINCYLAKKKLFLRL